MTTTADRIRSLIAEHLDQDPVKVTDTASFIDDLGADSLDMVEMLVAVEDAFEIIIPDDQAENLQTMADVVKYVEAQLASA